MHQPITVTASMLREIAEVTSAELTSATTFEARGTVLVPCGCRPPQRRPVSSSLQASIRDRIAEKRARGEDTTALESWL